MPIPSAREPHECPHCWLVFYGKGALTSHINREHWDKVGNDD
jgi:uncharacterized C2H2 Zn-finger protein